MNHEVCQDPIYPVGVKKSVLEDDILNRHGITFIHSLYLHCILNTPLPVFCLASTPLWASLGVDLDKNPGGYFLDKLCCKLMFLTDLIYFCEILNF